MSEDPNLNEVLAENARLRRRLTAKSKRGQKAKARAAEREKEKTELARRIYCAKHGHSNVVTACFGYIHCARCEAQVGDALASIYSNKEAVQVGHHCDICRENAKKLRRRDTALLPPDARAYLKELTS